jgi:hypothetical protein
LTQINKTEDLASFIRQKHTVTFLSKYATLYRAELFYNTVMYQSRFKFMLRTTGLSIWLLLLATGGVQALDLTLPEKSLSIDQLEKGEPEAQKNTVIEQTSTWFGMGYEQRHQLQNNFQPRSSINNTSVQSISNGQAIPPRTSSPGQKGGTRR